jgi:hypothetical protein
VRHVHKLLNTGHGQIVDADLTRKSHKGENKRLNRSGKRPLSRA